MRLVPEESIFKGDGFALPGQRRLDRLRRADRQLRRRPDRLARRVLGAGAACRSDARLATGEPAVDAVANDHSAQACARAPEAKERERRDARPHAVFRRRIRDVHVPPALPGNAGARHAAATVANAPRAWRRRTRRRGRCASCLTRGIEPAGPRHEPTPHGPRRSPRSRAGETSRSSTATSRSPAGW
jgi:hypothetical protein